MWDVESGQLVRTFAFSGAIKNVALSFDWDHLQVLFSIPESHDIFGNLDCPSNIGAITDDAFLLRL